MRVALLEDDPSLGDLVRAVLAGAGHGTHVYPDCRSIKVALRQESFDLLLLDWHLPDGEGIDVLHWARQKLKPCPPTIMVTAKAGNAEIRALDAGADDYVTKPLHPELLLARVGALLRRTYRQTEPDGGIEEISGATFDHADYSVTHGDEHVVLTAKEFGLALLFFRNMDRALSRSHLLETVWGRNPDLPTRTLDVHVSRLRSRLALRPERGYRLSPVHSFGYRLETIPIGSDKIVARA